MRRETSLQCLQRRWLPESVGQSKGLRRHLRSLAERRGRSCESPRHTTCDVRRACHACVGRPRACGSCGRRRRRDSEQRPSCEARSVLPSALLSPLLPLPLPGQASLDLDPSLHKTELKLQKHGESRCIRGTRLASAAPTILWYSSNSAVTSTQHTGGQPEPGLDPDGQHLAVDPGGRLLLQILHLVERAPVRIDVVLNLIPRGNKQHCEGIRMNLRMVSTKLEPRDRTFWSRTRHFVLHPLVRRSANDHSRVDTSVVVL